jgi:hypothetical protein
MSFYFYVVEFSDGRTPVQAAVTRSNDDLHECEVYKKFSVEGHNGVGVRMKYFLTGRYVEFL